MSEEEKIQEAAERDIDIPGYREDIKSYRFLFKTLEEEEQDPPILSSSFAEKVTEILEDRAVARIAFKELVWKVTVIILFLLVAVIALVSVDAEAEILDSLASIKLYVIIASLLLVIIDFLDKKFVRKII